MGTINGAYALGQAADTGSIETGKRADLTFWNAKDIRLPPLSPYAAASELAAFLIGSLSTGDITDVMIDGEFYVAGGQILTVLDDDLIEGFRKTWERFFPEVPTSAQVSFRRSVTLPRSPCRPDPESFLLSHPNVRHPWCPPVLKRDFPVNEVLCRREVRIRAR